MRVIIVGAGQVGAAITDALAGERADVVVIDLVEDRLRELRDKYDIQTVLGSGSNPQTLDEAGLGSADMLIAVTDADEVNMAACTIAKVREPLTIRVARIREAAFLKDAAILSDEGFGVDHAINPELVSARRIEEILEVPFATDVADCEPGLKLVGLRIPPDSPLEGMSFAKLRAMAPDLKILVTTRLRRGACHVPQGADDIKSGDTLYAVTRPADLSRVAELFHRPWQKAKRITIAGGTGIAEMLARRLERSGRYKVKLIEPNPKRAVKLAESLSRTLVLKGSPTDEGLLMEENIRDCDAYIAALPEAELNVMAALNAKMLGAHRVIALTDRFSYVPIIEASGVDAVVSPRALAVGTILHHIRKGKVKTVIPYGDGGQAEAIEFEALETSPVVGKPLRELQFPRGAIIGAVIRNNEAIIPGGSDVIAPGDGVYVFATKSAVPKLEKLMSVRFEFF